MHLSKCKLLRLRPPDLYIYHGEALRATPFYKSGLDVYIGEKEGMHQAPCVGLHGLQLCHVPVGQLRAPSVGNNACRTLVA